MDSVLSKFFLFHVIQIISFYLLKYKYVGHI